MTRGSSEGESVVGSPETQEPGGNQATVFGGAVAAYCRLCVLGLRPPLLCSCPPAFPTWVSPAVSSPECFQGLSLTHRVKHGPRETSTQELS